MEKDPNLYQYNILKEDFFKILKSERLEVFEGLLNGKLIEQEKYKDTYYISNPKKVLENLDNDIKRGEISYRYINLFYSKENELKEEEKLLSKLKIIALNQEDNAKIYFSIIDKYYSEIQKVLKDLHIILDDLLYFFFNKESKQINKIKDIIEDIENGQLNCYKNKYVNQIEEIKEKYLKDAQIRNLKKKVQYL